MLRYAATPYIRYLDHYSSTDLLLRSTSTELLLLDTTLCRFSRGFEGDDQQQQQEKRPPCRPDIHDWSSSLVGMDMLAEKIQMQMVRASVSVSVSVSVCVSICISGVCSAWCVVRGVYMCVCVCVCVF